MGQDAWSQEMKKMKICKSDMTEKCKRYRGSRHKDTLVPIREPPLPLSINEIGAA